MKTGYESVGVYGSRFMLNDVTNPIIRKLLSIQYTKMLARNGGAYPLIPRKKKGRPKIQDENNDA